jgi:hypothetical protein
LRVTLNSLVEVAGDNNAAEKFFKLMSTALRDEEDPKP